jgi:hypothetical protein
METLENTTKTPLTYERLLIAGNLKPILFSTPMVQSILRGEKTQTRRIIKYQKNITDPKIGFSAFTNNDQFEVRGVHENGQYGGSLFKMKYKVGDVLWVRETWQHTKCLNINPEDENYGFIYKADGQPWEDYENWTWKPSIFMPRSACRIFLKLTKIRIERLNDISEADAIAEGVERWKEERMISKPTHYKVYFQNCKAEDLCSYTSCPVDSYSTLWQKINGKKSWDENPYVFVYEFERCEVS